MYDWWKIGIWWRYKPIYKTGKITRIKFKWLQNELTIKKSKFIKNV